MYSIYKCWTFFSLYLCGHSKVLTVAASTVHVSDDSVTLTWNAVSSFNYHSPTLLGYLAYAACTFDLYSHPPCQELTYWAIFFFDLLGRLTQTRCVFYGCSMKRHKDCCKCGKTGKHRISCLPELCLRSCINAKCVIPLISGSCLKMSWSIIPQCLELKRTTYFPLTLSAAYSSWTVRRRHFESRLLRSLPFADADVAFHSKPRHKTTFITVSVFLQKCTPIRHVMAYLIFVCPFYSEWQI